MPSICPENKKENVTRASENGPVRGRHVAHFVEQRVGVTAADGAQPVGLVADGAEVVVLDDKEHRRADAQILRDVAEVALEK